MKRRLLGLVLAATVLGSAHTADAATKRILVVGDSWAMSICNPNRDGFPTKPVFNAALAANGLDDYEVEGGRTAWGGRQAAHWAKPENLKTVASELETYPTIDIVHLIIGGNDFLDSARKVDLHDDGVREEVFLTIQRNIQTIVDTCLSVRPTIRVVIADYDYLNKDLVGALLGTTFHDANQTEFNEWFTELGRRKLDIAKKTRRCEYVHNWGILQNHYQAPAEAPRPDGPPLFANYPGGDATAPMPDGAHVGDGVHPNEESHKHLLKNAIDQYYRPWLSGTSGHRATTGAVEGAPGP